MGMFARHNDKPLMKNGTPLMFKNYLTESIIHYEPMKDMYHSEYDGTWHYYKDCSLNAKFYPIYSGYDGFGGWPLFNIKTGMKLPTPSPHYNLYGISAREQHDNQTVQYYYDQADIINILESKEDWSISFWFTATQTIVQSGVFWAEYESYYQETTDRTLLDGPLKIQLISDDSSVWYMDALSGYPQLYPRFTTDYLLYRPSTATIKITIDSSIHTQSIENPYFKRFYTGAIPGEPDPDPSTGSCWNMYTIRKKDYFVECIFNTDFENSLKLNLNQDYHQSGYNRLGLLSNINNLTGYHSEGINSYIDEVFFLRKYLSNNEIRRLHSFRNLWY